jgi:tetratricopeptide (TPR) repeat protein
MQRRSHFVIAIIIVIAATLGVAVARASAQSEAPRGAMTPGDARSQDSTRAAQDSILSAAEAIVASDSTAVDEFERIATIYKERKRFAIQLQIAARMAQANPTSALAHLVHGDALLDNDQPEQAALELKAALALEYNYVRARVMLAETYEILGQPDSALAHLDTALRHNPRHAQAHMQMAKLLLRRGRTAEAVEHYRAACELLPDAPSSYGPWMKYAGALIANYAYSDAVDALRYCMRLQPAAADPYLLYAEALEKGGSIDKAIAAYNDFARRFPTDDRALDAERAALRLRYAGR